MEMTDAQVKGLLILLMKRSKQELAGALLGAVMSRANCDLEKVLFLLEALTLISPDDPDLHPPEMAS